MTETVRFPFNHNSGITPAELTQIITILPATDTILKGGAANYVSIADWKFAGERTEAPYICVVIEFIANAGTIIGDGTTQLIGLYGQINLNNTGSTPATRKRQLIGVLGTALTQPLPQIPITAQASGELVGYSHLTGNIAAYDALSIGGVFANIPVDPQVTVVARPIVVRNFLG